MQEVILRRFDDPDEVRTFKKGRFELVRHDPSAAPPMSQAGSGPNTSAKLWERKAVTPPMSAMGAPPITRL
jgi:hypothetical protein